MDNHILLTFDVEDWFQVENFNRCISRDAWPSCELRVEKNTHKLLDLLDSIPLQNCLPIRATFFILGWIAERLPHLVREIHARGHEVASHGHEHRLCNTQSPQDFSKDLLRSKLLLADLTGVPVYGYPR
jgi:polysaccharide deacetylase family protein (PEP-CTERM system associated)